VAPQPDLGYFSSIALVLERLLEFWFALVWVLVVGRYRIIVLSLVRSGLGSRGWEIGLLY
jgi:hypothetical protein